MAETRTLRKNVCANCLYWAAVGAGECHRNPPVVVAIQRFMRSAEGQTWWPDADPTNWCGEHRGAEQ